MIKFVKTLCYCDFNIYSNWELFDLDICEINHSLDKNEYVPWVIDDEIKLLLDKRFEDSSDDDYQKVQGGYHQHKTTFIMVTSQPRYCKVTDY